MVVRGALPRDPDAQLPNFSWDLLANHKCHPSTQKTAGIMIPALTFLLGSDQHPSCGPGLVEPPLAPQSRGMPTHATAYFLPENLVLAVLGLL